MVEIRVSSLIHIPYMLIVEGFTSLWLGDGVCLHLPCTKELAHSAAVAVNGDGT
jgi:hypothetical protein